MTLPWFLTDISMWMWLSFIVTMLAAAVVLFYAPRVALFAPVFVIMGVTADPVQSGLGFFIGSVLYAALVIIVVQGVREC